MPICRPILSLVLLALVGCGERPVVDVPVSHPANPNAAEAPAPAPSQTLALPDAAASTAPVSTSSDEAGHEGHHHEHHEPVSQAGEQQAQPAGSDAGVAPKSSGDSEHGEHDQKPTDATTPPSKSDAHDDSGTKATYTCPMHPSVVQAEPGRCPICHMKLVPKKLEGQP